MSWTTGTQTEALSVNNAVSTAFTGTSAAAVLMPTGAAYTPNNFFNQSLGQSKTITFQASGVLSTTTGTNTLTFGISANTTQGTYNSAAIMATNGGVNQSASLSSVPWELFCAITCVEPGSAGTYITSGIMKVYPTTSTLLAMKLSSSASTFSTQASYYWEYFANWSASSNSITVNSSVILGVN